MVHIPVDKVQHWCSSCWWYLGREKARIRSMKWGVSDRGACIVGVCVFQTLKLCLCPTLVRDEFSRAYINHSTTYAIA